MATKLQSRIKADVSPKSKIFLRVGALLMLLHSIEHSIGILSGTKPANDPVATVVAAMHAEHFNFMGRSTTLASFYTGYGVMLIFLLLFISILLLLLSLNFDTRVAFTLGIFLQLIGICEYIYLFPVASVFSSASGILTLLAILSTNGRSKNSST